MKRKLVLVLSVVMLLSVALCSCGSEKSITPAVATPRPTEDMYNLAMSCISKGQYEMGYSALLSIKDYEKAEEVLGNFFYLPGQITMRAKGEKNHENDDYVKFSYGSDGIIIGRDFYESSTYIGTEKFTYENGVLKTSEFSRNGLFGYTSAYTFDGEGKLTEVFLTDEEENFAKRNYTYNENGTVKEETITDYDGTVTVNVFEFDSDGKIVSKRSYSEKDGERTFVSKCEYTHNEKGLLVSALLTENGKETDIIYASNRLFYNPKHIDLMMFY